MLAITQDKELAELLLEHLEQYPFSWLLQIQILKNNLPLSPDMYKLVKDNIIYYNQKTYLHPGAVGFMAREVARFNATS
jgi:beta-lactamase class D